MTTVPTTAATTAAPTASTATGTGAPTTGPALTTGPAPTTGAAPAAVPVSDGRLGQGELRRRVAAVPADRPGNLFSPGEIAKELSRSPTP